MREGARSCREGAGNGRDARVEPLEWPPAPGHRRSRGPHLLPPPPRSARPAGPCPEAAGAACGGEEGSGGLVCRQSCQKRGCGVDDGVSSKLPEALGFLTY